MAIFQNNVMKTRLKPTNDPLSLLAGLSVGHIGMVTNHFHFNLINHNGGSQYEVLMQEPDGAVTLQAGPCCWDTAEQGHQDQLHLPSGLWTFCDRMSHLCSCNVSLGAPPETELLNSSAAAEQASSLWSLDESFATITGTFIVTFARYHEYSVAVSTSTPRPKWNGVQS